MTTLPFIGAWKIGFHQKIDGWFDVTFSRPKKNQWISRPKIPRFSPLEIPWDFDSQKPPGPRRWSWGRRPEIDRLKSTHPVFLVDSKWCALWEIHINPWDIHITPWQNCYFWQCLAMFDESLSDCFSSWKATGTCKTGSIPIAHPV